jgi:hypothetical protein
MSADCSGLSGLSGSDSGLTKCNVGFTSTFDFECEGECDLIFSECFASGGNKRLSCLSLSSSFPFASALIISPISKVVYP